MSGFIDYKQYPTVTGLDDNWTTQGLNAPMQSPTSVNNLTSANNKLDITHNIPSQQFGANPATFGAIAGGVQGLAGLANAYIGWKNYWLQKDAFGFQKKLARANYTAQAKDYNTRLTNAASMQGQMIGSRDANGNFGMTDPAVTASIQNQANARKVSENLG